MAIDVENATGPPPAKKNKKEAKLEQDRWIEQLSTEPENLDFSVIDKFVKEQLKQSATPEMYAGPLTQILRLGTPTSIAAFQGLLYLILEKNVAMDNLYQEAYNLLKPSVCYSQYAPQLLETVSLALTSPYIPKYMLIAFVKRLARLALGAPAAPLIKMLAVLKDLLVRYRAIFKPILSKEEPANEDADPFNDEATLADCRASDSSLWELKSLVKQYQD